jgi:hypothetical protein
MNERIEELWKESRTNEDPGYDYKKFAEAVIRECCIALHPMLRDMISRGQGQDMILEHFGIDPKEISMLMRERLMAKMEKQLAEKK